MTAVSQGQTYSLLWANAALPSGQEESPGTSKHRGYVESVHLLTLSHKGKDKRTRDLFYFSNMKGYMKEKP